MIAYNKVQLVRSQTNSCCRNPGKTFRKGYFVCQANPATRQLVSTQKAQYQAGHSAGVHKLSQLLLIPTQEQQKKQHKQEQSIVVGEGWGQWCSDHNNYFQLVMEGKVPFEQGIHDLHEEFGQFPVKELLGTEFLDQVDWQVKAVWIGLSGDPRQANLRIFATLNPYLPPVGSDDMYWIQCPNMPLDVSFNNYDVLVDGIKYFFVLTAGEVTFSLEQCLPPNAILRQNQFEEPIFRRKVWGGIGIIEFLADADEASIRSHCQKLKSFHSENFYSKDWMLSRLYDRWGRTLIQQHPHVLQDNKF